MTEIEQLRKERDDYRKTCLIYRGLYHDVLKLYSEAVKKLYGRDEKTSGSLKKNQCLSVQFKR